MKLHLGCGNIYLKGYINIDFPLSEHTLVKRGLADVYQDILKLKYPANSIDEIRLHHVFEHFTRPIACALISGWYLWLKPGGILHIEVPDFYRTAKVIFNPLAKESQKTKALRHLYGSHEAPWAVHCEGYTPESLSKFLENYGFKITKVRRNSWKGTYNFEIISEKSVTNLNITSLENITKNYLKQFLIDRSKSELHLLSVWMEIYRKQIRKNV